MRQFSGRVYRPGRAVLYSRPFKPSHDTGMGDEHIITDEERETAQAADPTIDDALRALRLRRYEQQRVSPSSAEDLSQKVEEQLEEAVAGEVDEDAASEADVHAVQEEAHSVFSELFEGLNDEVRRMGREMFRANRTAERNQELFDEATREIHQLAASVALIPAQHQETIHAAKYETKAEICRELLRMADTFAASLAAVNDLIQQLETKAGRPQQGLAFRFSATRNLSDGLAQAIAAMKQWRDGQQLLAERLQAILRAAGVREIETAGRAFDPDQHRASSAVPRDDVAPGTIIGEELKGYTLEGKILRYPEVIVAKHE